MSAFKPDFSEAEVRASPNFGARRDGLSPELIVLHYTGMESGQAAEDWLCDPRSEVSSHYIVHEDGRVVQMVREADRAWHAGHSHWLGRGDVNSRSIGIEITNPGPEGGQPDFSDPQLDSVIALCRDVAARRHLPPSAVVAHSDVAPGRKIDPGERFPWRRLALAGVCLWVEPEPIAPGRELTAGDESEDVKRMQRMLSRLGYGVPSSGFFDEATHHVVAAFQRRFRPERCDGVADRSTLVTLERLLQAVKDS